MKKIISTVIAGIMLLVFGITAYAAVMPFVLGSSTRESILMINGNTATCTSKYSASDDAVSEIIITQSLERHLYLWVWETVGGEWSTSSGGSSISFTNTASGLSGGTYRVKNVFDATGKNGEKESQTLYSAEKKVN